MYIYLYLYLSINLSISYDDKSMSDSLDVPDLHPQKMSQIKYFKKSPTLYSIS